MMLKRYQAEKFMELISNAKLINGIDLVLAGRMFGTYWGRADVEIGILNFYFLYSTEFDIVMDD